MLYMFSRPLSPGRFLPVALLLVMLGGCEDVNVTTVGAGQVSISPPTTFVKVGETTQLNASVLSSDGQALAGRTIQWTSLNEAIASVDNTGLVRGLTAGTATIRATAEGASGTAEVTVTSGPAIQATPDTVEFVAIRGGASPGDRTVAITNVGDGTLSGLAVSISYPAAGPTGWLSANLVGRSAPASLVLGATLGSLAVGTYSATVTITSPVASNSPLDVQVELQVLAPSPAIALGANTVGFNAVQGGGNPASQTVAVTNAGGGTLSGLGVSTSYASGQPSGWLTATLGASTAPTSITLTAATGSLAPGTYSATVRVASGVAQNSPQDITVTFTVGTAQPSIGAQPNSLTFTGASPAPQQVQLTNSGGGTLGGLSVSVSYPGGQPSGWLATNLSGTTAPATLTVTASAGTLPAGSYTATVRITAAGAANSPLDVPVTLTVPQPVPAPGVPTGVTASAISTSQINVTWTAASGTVTEYRIERKTGAGGSYAQVQIVSGTSTSFGDTGLLANTEYFYRVRACNGTGCSAYSTEASATTPAPAPSPVIALGANTVGFNAVQGGSNPAAQTVAVTNGGGGTLSGLSVSISYGSGSPGWLNAALGATTAPTDITLTAATGSLSAGTYSATVRVASGVAQNSPQDITVTFTIGAAAQPSIGAQPTSLTFTGASPADQQIQLTNTGGGTLSGLSVLVSYASGQPTGWLSTNLSSTTAPATLTVGASSASLPAGSYTATIQITAPGATNSPLDVQVTFTVPEPVPGVPTGVTATAISASQIDVTWTAATGTVTEYRVERKTGAGGTYAQVQIVSGSNTSFSDTGLAASTEYFYRVLACNSGGCSAPSTEASATTQAGTPNSPTTLSAQAVSSSAIDLQWSHDGLFVTQFELQRAPGTDPTNFQPLAITLGSARSYQDTGLTPATNYVYRVRACALLTCSAWSNTATATTAASVATPPVPTGVSATPTSQTQVRVTWNAVAGVTHYSVQRQNAVGGKKTQTFTVPGTDTFFDDSGLSPQTAYDYSVAACNQNGCSVLSAPVRVTTL